MRKLSLLFVMLAFASAGVDAADGKLVGKINKVNTANGEIIVATSSGGESIKIGDKMYSRIDGKIVLMIAVFPMMTSSKCRTAPGFKSYIPLIKPGLPVYSYASVVAKDIDKNTIEQSGSINELAMLCGKNFNDDLVQNYLKTVGDGKIVDLDGSNTDYSIEGIMNSITGDSPAVIEVLRANDGNLYSIRNKGVAVKFDQNSILTEIILYMDGVQGFSKYPHDLPEKIVSSDTRKDVEQKIGKPTKTGGEGLLPFWAEYPHFGFRVTYWTESATSMSNSIRFISIKRPVY